MIIATARNQKYVKQHSWFLYFFSNNDASVCTAAIVQDEARIIFKSPMIKFKQCLQIAGDLSILSNLTP